jgi:hypothetical protein
MNDLLLPGGLLAAALALAERGYSDVGRVGERAFEEMSGPGGLAERLPEMQEFRPYTVTSATGGQFGMTQDPTTGEMTYALTTSPEEQAFQQAQFGRAGQFFEQAAQPTVAREQAVYDRMRAAMLPEERRQQLALEERLRAQGRLGVRTAQFGGTSEQLALAQAQEEARNRALLSAMQQAQAEQVQQAQLGSGMLASGYVPQAQLLGAMAPGMTAAEAARQSQLAQAQSYGETYTTGLEALLQSALGQAGIAGGFGTTLAGGALGGLFK